jgi:hypothetical protein
VNFDFNAITSTHLNTSKNGGNSSNGSNSRTGLFFLLE